MSHRHNNVTVVVPAFNESEKIVSVVRSLRERGYTVVVVDDGSHDTTAILAKKAGAHTLRHIINLGQGASLQTGIDSALRTNADSIVTYDADGQFDPDDVALLLTTLEKEKLDVVLGSRFLKSQRIPIARKLLLKAALLFTRITTGLRITDTHNGLRAFTRSAARTITLTQPRMAHASEIFSEIATHNLSYGEVPVTVRYTDYSQKKGQSGFAGFRILFDLFFRK